MLGKAYPCLVVKGNEFKLIGTGLLRDGRYELVRVEDSSEPARAPVIAEDLDAFADGEKDHG
jgi:hypothetical protein